MEIICSDYKEVRFRHHDGNVYTGRIGGCGEAFTIRDSNHNMLTQIPLVEWATISPEDLEVAEIAITAIGVNKWLHERKDVEDAEIITEELVAA